MNRICNLSLLALLLTISSQGFSQTRESELSGAWRTQMNGETSVVIFADGYFSVARYKDDAFINTYGGSFILDGNSLKQMIEFNASDSTKVGTTIALKANVEEEVLQLDGHQWKKIGWDENDLQGAWLITGRERNGELSRTTPGVRKTMKILNGGRFQWIAYNTETGQFFGTGGGTYEAKNGKYTENIEFFSRDSSRIGASLGFDYEVKDREWHHSGNNSRGEPLLEIWTLRSALEGQ